MSKQKHHPQSGSSMIWNHELESCPQLFHQGQQNIHLWPRPFLIGVLTNQEHIHPDKDVMDSGLTLQAPTRARRFDSNGPSLLRHLECAHLMDHTVRHDR